MKTIVILGGGIGGIVAANELRKRLNPEQKIIVIEKNRVHAFAPSFLWLMTGTRKTHEIAVDVSSLLYRGIDLRNEEVTAISPGENYVETEKGKIHFDYLVASLGAELHPGLLPGLPSDAHDYYTANGAESLYKALQKFDKGKIALVIASLPYKCPAAPYEGAMLISDFFAQKGSRENIEISLFTPEPYPMPVGGPALGESVKQVLESKEINFYPLHKIFEVDGQKRKLLFENNSKHNYDLLVVVPPHKAPGVILRSPLAGENGWIPVDRSTLQTKYPNVYAIGDVTAVSIPGRWKQDIPLMLPKAGIFAHLQAESVAQRISDEIKGISSKSEFCGDGFCMLEAGEHAAGIAFGNFFASPSPEVKIRNVRKAWHYGKILFEKWWLSSFGIKKSFLKLLMKTGSKMMRIPIKI